MKAILCSVLVVLVVAGIFEAALPPPDNNFGGYHNREIADADVQEMAAFAAQEMGHELMEILAAQSAVVAGTNYRMELSLRKGSNTKTCTVVVFRGLMNSGNELTSSEC